MKLITKEEKAAMKMHPMNNQGKVRSALLCMKVADILFLETEDWTWKSATPGYLCRRVEAKTDMKFDCEEVLKPSTGWVITRLQ